MTETEIREAYDDMLAASGTEELRSEADFQQWKTDRIEDGAITL